jgi:hypothetical protein
MLLLVKAAGVAQGCQLGYRGLVISTSYIQDEFI